MIHNVSTFTICDIYLLRAICLRKPQNVISISMTSRTPNIFLFISVWVLWWNDFTTPRTVPEQVHMVRGYSHCYLLYHLFWLILLSEIQRWGFNWEYKQTVLHWYRCIPIVWNWLLRFNWWLLLPCIQNVSDLNVSAEVLIDGSCCHVFQIYLINIPGEGLIGGSCCHIFQMSRIKVLAGGLIGGSCCHVFQMFGIYVPAEDLIDGSCCHVSQMSGINVPTEDLIDGSCCHVVILKIIIKSVQ